MFPETYRLVWRSTKGHVRGGQPASVVAPLLEVGHRVRRLEVNARGVALHRTHLALVVVGTVEVVTAATLLAIVIHIQLAHDHRLVAFALQFLIATVVSVDVVRVTRFAREDYVDKGEQDDDHHERDDRGHHHQDVGVEGNRRHGMRAHQDRRAIFCGNYTTTTLVIVGTRDQKGFSIMKLGWQ